MVAGVAHEMNNPLHFLRGNLSLLRREIPQSAATAPLLADIDESVERMTSVTRQLLLFGRKHGPGTEAVKLTDVVPLVVRMMSPQVPTGVRILQKLEGDSVRANPQDLFQIITNIVHNAVQAVDPKAGGEVSISSAPLGAQIELRVVDNGCGIARENLTRIFDPFFTTKPPGSGTGLGLSIVRELVTAQEGSLRVESEQGRGTTVAVLLHPGQA
jgi:signal transduction histidine kinase